jgi:serine/threonine protein kinase
MVYPIDLRGPFQIQHTVGTGDDVNIPPALLPKQYIDGRIMVGQTQRCSIQYKKMINRGGYGNISRIIRSPPLGELCIKTPHKSDFSLCPEALLQWVASQALKTAGIHGAIPHIYDIFQYAGETRFTMDFIGGVSAVQAVVDAADPDKIWLQILAQVSLILGFLEERIHLDHRDLKADNLWIRQAPVSYHLTVGGIAWRLEAPFQVVILDFGFACLGGADGNATVSLSDGLLPKIDPCPKEGRDLFQLVASMWSIPIVRGRFTDEVQAAMEALLTHRESSYLDLVLKNLHPHWIYLAVSDSAFRHPPLHPVTLLLKLSRDWPATGLTRE